MLTGDSNGGLFVWGRGGYSLLYGRGRVSVGKQTQLHLIRSHILSVIINLTDCVFQQPIIPLSRNRTHFQNTVSGDEIWLLKC